MSDSKDPSSRDQPTLAEGELPLRLLSKLRIEIPGYQMLDEIARGGQATVYRATELTSGLTVAIKLLHAGPHANEASRQRLQREIAALKALNHPNIVCVIEAGQTTTGLDYLVMNYIAGHGLDEYWRDRKTIEAEAEDPAKLLRLFQQICETMAAAHRKGITHRDLSPSNIRIDESGQPHILDFGLASTAFDGYLTPGGGELSLTGQFIGKLAYASPEQAKGDRGQIDIRTDVYALGVILYQILTRGAYPYEVVGNLVDVLNNIIHSKPKPPSEVLSQTNASAASAAVIQARKKRIDPTAINATIEAIVLKALEKNPEQRYQSAGELAREIEQYLRGKPLLAPPVTSKPAPPAAKKRSRLATAITAALLAAIVALLVLLILPFARPLASSPRPTTAPAEQTMLASNDLSSATRPAGDASMFDPASAKPRPIPASPTAAADPPWAATMLNAAPASATLLTTAHSTWRSITPQQLMLSNQSADVVTHWPDALLGRRLVFCAANVSPLTVRVDQPGMVLLAVPRRYWRAHVDELAHRGFGGNVPIEQTASAGNNSNIVLIGKPCAAGEVIEFVSDNREILPRVIVAGDSTPATAPAQIATTPPPPAPPSATPANPLSVGGAWVGVESINNSNRPASAKITAIDNNAVTLEIDDGQDSLTWTLVNGSDAKVLDLKSKSKPTTYSIVSSHAWVNISSINASGQLTIAARRAPKTQQSFSIDLHPATAATATPEPPKTVGPFTLGGKWTGTSMNDGAEHSIVAYVTDLDDRSLTLREAAGTLVHDYIISIEPNKHYTVDAINLVSGDTENRTLSDIHMSGQIDNGRLVLQGTLTIGKGDDPPKVVNRTMTLSPEQAAPTNVIDALMSRCGVTVGSHWTGTTVGSDDNAPETTSPTPATVVAVNADRFTLRFVTPSGNAHDLILHVDENGGLSGIDDIESSPKQANLVLTQVHQAGTLSPGILKIAGSDTHGNHTWHGSTEYRLDPPKPREPAVAQSPSSPAFDLSSVFVINSHWKLENKFSDGRFDQFDATVIEASADAAKLRVIATTTQFDWTLRSTDGNNITVNQIARVPGAGGGLVYNDVDFKGALIGDELQMQGSCKVRGRGGFNTVTNEIRIYQANPH